MRANLTEKGVILVAVAASAEVRAVLRGLGSRDDPDQASGSWPRLTVVGGCEVAETGIGKANAAAAVARVLDLRRHRAVVSLGVGGVLPGAGLELGGVVVGEFSVFADEGLETGRGFVDCAAMGFPLGPPPGVVGSRVMADAELLARFEPVADQVCAIATVSTCSGTDALAGEVVRRTGAAVEAMEGAAVGLACARLGAPFIEVRVVSNTTGARSTQRWDLSLALERLATTAGRLVEAMSRG
ncbi:MAG: futalosine hydrolase [Phycisphaeraceae bacterium]|nr:futalosine hydrolase [Phycisphaeraceae bacterium]